MPWKGLIPKWRFVLPSEYKGLLKWGITTPGTNKKKVNKTSNINEILKIPNESNTSQSNNTSIEQSIINKIGK